MLSKFKQNAFQNLNIHLNKYTYYNFKLYKHIIIIVFESYIINKLYDSKLYLSSTLR